MQEICFIRNLTFWYQVTLKVNEETRCTFHHDLEPDAVVPDIQEVLPGVLGLCVEDDQRAEGALLLLAVPLVTRLDAAVVLVPLGHSVGPRQLALQHNVVGCQ